MKILDYFIRCLGYIKLENNPKVIASIQEHEIELKTHISELKDDARLKSPQINHISKNENLARQVNDLKNEIKELKTKKILCDDIIENYQWHLPSLAAFPSFPYINKSFQLRTLYTAQIFQPKIRNLLDFCDKDSFVDKKGLGIFYWSLAHAAVKAQYKVKKLQTEDACSAAFLQALIEELQTKSNVELSNGFGIGFNLLFQNKEPLLKEKFVGADILLIVSGDALVPGGGSRLIWIQAKINATKEPYEIDIYRAHNTDGFNQFQALWHINQPKNGSFGMYLSYDIKFDFSIAVSMNNLGHVNSEIAEECKISLKDPQTKSSRAQELITALIAEENSDLGSFIEAEDLIKFIDSATEKLIIPLEVLSIQGGNQLITLDQINEVANIYQKRVDDYLSKNYAFDDDPDDQTPIKGPRP